MLRRIHHIIVVVFLSYIILTQSFSLVLGSEAFAQQQDSTWEMVDHPFSSDDALFWDVSFVNGSYGWIVGQDPLIMYTPNGGSDWYEQSVPDSAKLFSIEFINYTYGWAVGQDGIILRTTHGDDLGEELVVDTINLSLILSLGLIAGIIGIASIVVWRKKRTPS